MAAFEVSTEDTRLRVAWIHGWRALAEGSSDNRNSTWQGARNEPV